MGFNNRICGSKGRLSGKDRFRVQCANDSALANQFSARSVYRQRLSGLAHDPKRSGVRRRQCGLLGGYHPEAPAPRHARAVLRSKEIGIIGVGESTTLPLVNHLHGYLGMDLTEFYRLAQPTHKLAGRFLWGRDHTSTTA